MNGNPDKPLSLMDELSHAGFGRAKVDSFSSQEDFTANMNSDPVIRLNFSDMEDITSFNAKNFASSTPLVVRNSAPVESDDVTVDSNVFKGYTQKLVKSPMLFQRNIKPVSQSDTSEPSSHQGFGLNLEPELQQAKSQSRNADNECPLKDNLDDSKDLVSPCSNVGLSIRPDVLHAKSQNNIADVSNNRCPVTGDLDVSKDLALPNSNVGLSLEQEIKQATLQNECPLKNDLVVNTDLISPKCNVGLNLEQELQQDLFQMDSHVINNGNPFKSDLDVSKDLSQTNMDCLKQELQQATSQNSNDNGYPLKGDLGISKDLSSSCSNVGLTLEQEHQQGISRNDRVDGVSNNIGPVTNDLDATNGSVLPNGIVGLSLQQELQQAISETSNASVIDNECPLKHDRNSSKNDVNLVTLEPENESLNLQQDFTEPENKDLLELADKMETSMSRKTFDLKQELGVMENSSSSDEEKIVENGSEVLKNEENVSDRKFISPECPGETDKHIAKKSCTPSKKNSNHGDELGVLNYLSSDKERLNSFSVSMASNMSANSIDLKESDECVNDLPVKNRDSFVGVRKKRNLILDSSLSLTTDVSPEKKNKIYSEINLSRSVSEAKKTTEIGLKQNNSPEVDILKFDAWETDLHTERFDNAHLKTKVELLEKELGNQQRLTTQAAQLGMQVVEENNDLKEKIENLLTSIATAEEEKENERHANKLKLQHKDYMEQQYNEEISHLKDDVSRVKETLETTEREKATMARQLRTMEYSSEQSQLKEQQLTTTIEHLEKLLKEKTDQPFPNPTFNQTDDDGTIEQITAMQQEILDLQNNNTVLKSQLISHEANIKRLEEELVLCQQCKKNKEQEIDEMKYEINSYYKAVESSQMDIMDLKAQLHAAQIENMSHKDRGNSLFSEVEDRRVLAEKMVATLQRNYEALKKRFNAEKQQHHKLKMQAVSLLQMNSDRVSEDYARQLNSMLHQTKNELKELQEKVKNYKRNEAQQAEKLVKIQETFGTNENRDLIEFLNSLNDIKQKELDEMKAKLDNMEMQYLQESSKVVDHIKKLRLTEEEIKSLRCTNMKLRLRIEELLMKFNPDELLEEKSSKKIYVEKIPLGPTENLIQSLTKQKDQLKTQTKVPAEKQPKCKAQQIAELVRSGAINPVDVLKESHKAKKKVVSMSSEVTVIDNDGKEEKKTNLDTENVPAKLERRRQPQGKFAPADKIIEVKSPVHGRRADCKQQ